MSLSQQYDGKYGDSYRAGPSRGASYHGGAPSEDEDEVDSIPIVKLDLDLRSPSPRQPTPPPREPTPPPMFVDVEGELPPSAAPATSHPATPTPPTMEEAATEPAPEKAEAVAAEGAAVKVVKKKKKKPADGIGSTKTKKSRTPVEP